MYETLPTRIRDGMKYILLKQSVLANQNAIENVTMAKEISSLLKTSTKRIQIFLLQLPSVEFILAIAGPFLHLCNF